MNLTDSLKYIQSIGEISHNGLYSSRLKWSTAVFERCGGKQKMGWELHCPVAKQTCKFLKIWEDVELSVCDRRFRSSSGSCHQPGRISCGCRYSDPRWHLGRPPQQHSSSCRRRPGHDESEHFRGKTARNETISFLLHRMLWKSNRTSLWSQLHSVSG